MFLNKSPAPSVVKEKAATLLYCEAPELLCGLWNFTQLSIGKGGEKQWLHFQFWMNLSFKLWQGTNSFCSDCKDTVRYSVNDSPAHIQTWASSKSYFSLQPFHATVCWCSATLCSCSLSTGNVLNFKMFALLFYSLGGHRADLVIIHKNRLLLLK